MEHRLLNKQGDISLFGKSYIYFRCLNRWLWWGWGREAQETSCCRKSCWRRDGRWGGRASLAVVQLPELSLLMKMLGAGLFLPFWEKDQRWNCKTFCLSPSQTCITYRFLFAEQAWTVLTDQPSKKTVYSVAEMAENSFINNRKLIPAVL